MSALNLQKAIYTKLNTDLSIPVYDFVPETQTGIFVVIGDQPMNSFNDKLENGFSADPLIHIWGDKDCGRKQILQAQSDVYDSLHRQALTITGGTWIDTNFTFSEVIREPDGITYHGVQRFNILYTVD